MSSERFFRKLKRAAVTAALFFTTTAQAGSTETYKDIIEKAYNLSLQKDRAQAVSILLTALKREAKKSSAQRDLAQALNQVSKVFYGDKALQLYELALSLRITDPALGISKLQEAVRLEPENLSIELALARGAIFQGDCDGALSKMLKQKELRFYIEDIKLLQGQAQVCLGKFEDYLINKSEVDPRRSPFSLSWQALEAEYLFKTGNFSKTRELAMTFQKSDRSFPESHYWIWKAEVEMKIGAEVSGQKYLTACKALKGRQIRDYLFEPQLCHRTAEVETFLKKNNNPEQ